MNLFDEFMSVVSALDSPEATEVVGYLPAAMLIGGDAEQRCDVLPQFVVGEAAR